MPYFVKSRTASQTRDSHPSENEKPVTGFELRVSKNPVRENNPGIYHGDFENSGNTASEISEDHGNCAGNFRIISGLSGANKLQIRDIPGYFGNLEISEVDHA